MESPTNQSIRRGTTAGASSAGGLPLDILFDVLLRIPAKEICRLRGVCRAWRAFSSDPLFIEAHGARHPGPLLLAKFLDDDAHVHVVDLVGNVLKRIAGAGDDHQLLCTNLDLACLCRRVNSCRVLNPATGAVVAVPKYPELGDPNRSDLLCKPGTFYAFGQVPSTGEYKVIRMFNRSENRRFDEQLFDVFTINGGASNALWRVLSRDNMVAAESAVVVDGAVYFLMNRKYYPKRRNVHSGFPPDYIASLDIGTEQWRRDLLGPISDSLI